MEDKDKNLTDTISADDTDDDVVESEAALEAADDETTEEPAAEPDEPAPKRSRNSGNIAWLALFLALVRVAAVGMQRSPTRLCDPK